MGLYDRDYMREKSTKGKVIPFGNTTKKDDKKFIIMIVVAFVVGYILGYITS